MWCIHQKAWAALVGLDKSRASWFPVSCLYAILTCVLPVCFSVGSLTRQRAPKAYITHHHSFTSLTPILFYSFFSPIPLTVHPPTHHIPSSFFFCLCASFHHFVTTVLLLLMLHLSPNKYFSFCHCWILFSLCRKLQTYTPPSFVSNWERTRSHMQSMSVEIIIPSY